MDATGRTLAFDPKMQAQRTGLGLANGVVLIGWGSHEDAAPYHGWVMGYDATTLARVGIFCVSPDTSAGGIWQGGRAPAIDAAGNAYFATGNGPWDGTRSFGDSLLKFSVRRSGMSVVDFFTPANQSALYLDDDDLSGSGFTILPGSNLLLGGGKEGVLYLLDPAHLGQLTTNDGQALQKIAGTGWSRDGRASVLELRGSGASRLQLGGRRRAQVVQGELGATGDAGICAGWSGVGRTSRGISHRVGERRGPGDGDCLGIDADFPGRRPRPRGWNPSGIRRRDTAADLDERAERRPRSDWNADEIRSSGRRQRQGLHAESGRGGGGVRPPAGAGG